jgi:hypothetical protein
MASFTKQPSELFTIAVDFTDRMATGEALASAVVTATDSTGTDRTATVIATYSVSTPNVLVRVKAGTDGTDYKITVVATTATSEVYETDITMRVRAE